MNILENCDAAARPFRSKRRLNKLSVPCWIARGAVAVWNENTRVAGIFTERDVLRRLSLSGREPAKHRSAK